MANRKATMTDIRVIIREFVRGTSLREMERKLKISRTSLRAYRDRAEASGKAMVDLLKLEEAELNAIMVKGDGHRSRDADREQFEKEELPKKQTFENRVLSPEPKFVQKRRQLADSKDTYEDVSTFEKEIPEKS